MPPRHATRALVTAAVLVGLVTGCTAGAGESPSAGRPSATAPGAAPSPTSTDPAAATVRAAGSTLTPNGVVVSAVTAAGASVSSTADADGSVHLQVTAGTAAAAPTATSDGADSGAGGGAASGAAAPQPLAWLTGPAGSTAGVLEDGSAVISAADGSFLVGLTAPVPSARFTVVGTPAAVLRIDHVPSAASATTDPTGTVTSWLSGRAVVGAVWTEAEGGRSLEVTPSAWARTGTLGAQQALWSQLVADQPDAGTPTMHEQLLCHVLGAAGKSTWNLEPWRPQVDALTMLRTRCNPTAADVATPPAPTAATS